MYFDSKIIISRPLSTCTHTVWFWGLHGLASVLPEVSRETQWLLEAVTQQPWVTSATRLTEQNLRVCKACEWVCVCYLLAVDQAASLSQLEERHRKDSYDLEVSHIKGRFVLLLHNLLSRHDKVLSIIFNCASFCWFWLHRFNMEYCNNSFNPYWIFWWSITPKLQLQCVTDAQMNNGPQVGSLPQMGI